MSTAGIVIALARRAENHIVEHLRETGAASASRSQPLPRLHLLGRRRLRRMLAAGAVREASPGEYYLDETALAAYRQQRRRHVLAMIGASLLAAAGIIGFTRK